MPAESRQRGRILWAARALELVRFLHSGCSQALPDPKGPEDKEDASINR
jgi:hypothetical protein